MITGNKDGFRAEKIRTADTSGDHHGNVYVRRDSDEICLRTSEYLPPSAHLAVDSGNHRVVVLDLRRHIKPVALWMALVNVDGSLEHAKLYLHFQLDLLSI